MSKVLKFADQEIMSDEECGDFISNPSIETDGVMCAKFVKKIQGTCLGDAGAPLVVNENGQNTLVGLLSVVQKTRICRRSPDPVIFTRITGYFHWIETMTGYKIRP